MCALMSNKRSSMDTRIYVLVTAVVNILVAGENCVIYKDGNRIDTASDGIGLLKDVGKPGEIIRQYETTDVQDITVGNSKYLDVTFENGTLYVAFTADYETWEMYENFTYNRPDVNVKLQCSDGESRDLLLYGIIEQFSNGYDPVFEQGRDKFLFVIPMPFPAGLSVTLNFGDDSNKIVVIDYDINENDINRKDVTFDLAGEGSEMFEIRNSAVWGKQYTAELRTRKTLQLKGNLELQLIATDNDNQPQARSSYGTVVIQPDLSTLPVAPPTFQEPLYAINVTESDDPAVEVVFTDGYKQDKTTLKLSHCSGEDLTSFFIAEKHSESSVVVKKRGEIPNEVLERYFGIMLLEATTEGVTGKTVIEVILPGSNPVVITTTESTTTDTTTGTTESSDPGTSATTTTDSSTTDSSTTDSSNTESSTTDSSNTESSTTDSSTTDSSTSDSSTTDSSTTDSSTTDSSTTDSSTTDSSTTDSSTTDSSTTDSSTTDSSTTDSSTTDSSTTDSSTTDSSNTESSTTDSSTTDSSTTDSSTTDSSTTDSSTTDSSTTDSSTTDYSTTDSSTTDYSTTHSSTTDYSTTHSSTTYSSTTDSSNAGSSTTDSSNTGSSTTDSSNTGSSTTDSSNTGSSTTDSSNTESSTTDSSNAGSSTTDSSNTGSSTTDSSNTGSSTTDSSNTGSSTTDSSNTESSTTDSSTTDSSTTDSSTTDSSTTDSSNTDPTSSDSYPTETPTTIAPPAENLWNYTVLVMTFRETTATSVPLPYTGVTNMNCNFSLQVDPSEATSLFTIDAGGTVSTAAPIDRESKIFNQSNIVRLKLFRSCDDNAAYSRPSSSDVSWGNIGPQRIEYNVTGEENAMLLVIKVEDVNDNRPFFREKSLTVGYPSKDLVMEILPPSLVTVQAVDLDIGDNAKIEYMIGASRKQRDDDDDDDDDDDHEDDDHDRDDDTTQFVVHKDTGVVYPRQGTFRYKDTSFSVAARDSVGVGGSIQINVRILKKDNMAVIYQEGSTLEDTQKVLHALQEAAGLKHVLTISAAVVADDKQVSRRTSLRKDESHTLLRLIVYGIDGNRNLVPASSIVRAADETPGVVKAEEWHPSSLVSEANTGPLIPVVILSILLLISAAAMAFLVYRLRHPKESGARNLSRGTNSYPFAWWKKPMKKCFGSSYEAFSGTSSKQASVSSMDAGTSSNPNIPMSMMSIERETTVADGAAVQPSDSNRSSVTLGNSVGESDDSVSQDDGKDSLVRRKSLVTFNENVEQIEIEKL